MRDLAHWIGQIRNGLDRDILVQNEIWEVLTQPRDKASPFAESLKKVLAKYFVQVVKFCGSSSFQIEEPDRFERNLEALSRLESAFGCNDQIREIFTSKREKWVSFFCSKSIKQLEVYLLNFSSLISSYGFARAGRTRPRLDPRREVPVDIRGVLVRKNVRVSERGASAN